MDEHEWVKTLGNPALKRALEEGYEIRSGLATQLFDTLADQVSMDRETRWMEVAERTSPTAETFAKRDLVVDCAKSLSRPEGWSLEVSKIVRVSLSPREHFTGVTVDIRDATRKHIARTALNFETMY